MDSVHIHAWRFAHKYHASPIIIVVIVATYVAVVDVIPLSGYLDVSENPIGQYALQTQ